MRMLPGMSIYTDWTQSRYYKPAKLIWTNILSDQNQKLITNIGIQLVNHYNCFALSLNKIISTLWRHWDDWMNISYYQINIPKKNSIN